MLVSRPTIRLAVSKVRHVMDTLIMTLGFGSYTSYEGNLTTIEYTEMKQLTIAGIEPGLFDHESSALTARPRMLYSNIARVLVVKMIIL